MTEYKRLQLKAHRAVNYAIKSGKITRQKCEKCDLIGQAHHDDYTKSLDIRWLCRDHHIEHHALELERTGMLPEQIYDLKKSQLQTQ